MTVDCRTCAWYKPPGYCRNATKAFPEMYFALDWNAMLLTTLRESCPGYEPIEMKATKQEAEGK